MKRLLFVLCLLAATQAVAKKPVRFEVPYTVEYGKYVVVLETPVGPRRFVFDTGSSRTVITERLCGELGLVPEQHVLVADFEGHALQIGRVVIDSLRMGCTLFRQKSVDVLPDSSYVFRCLGFDGLIGSDLMKEYVVRMPNADSTITFASDIRLLGKMNRANSTRMVFAGRTCPMVVPRLSSGKNNYTVYMKFDTGYPDLLACRYDECLALIRNDVVRDVRRIDGHSSNLGWTNRSVRNEAVRGVIPMFELAGSVLEGIPFGVTHGSTSKLGCEIFRWGRVVMDFSRRRFYLLPHAEQPGPPDTSVRNITFAIDGGRLIVGQVWDESLREIVEPGDRIVLLGTIPVDRIDCCAFIRGEIHPDKPQITVERADGSRVSVPITKL